MHERSKQGQTFATIIRPQACDRRSRSTPFLNTMSSGMTTSVAIHQQLEIIDVRNDLRLPRDHGIERGAPGLGSPDFQNWAMVGLSNTRFTAVTC